MTSQEIKEIAKRLGADEVAIGSIDRWEGAPSQQDLSLSKAFGDEFWLFMTYVHVVQNKSTRRAWRRWHLK